MDGGIWVGVVTRSELKTDRNEDELHPIKLIHDRHFTSMNCHF